MLEHIVGDVQSFVCAFHERLCAAGIDALARGYQMDHVCFRVETVMEYRSVLAALVPSLGEKLIESMIGGRPISIVRLLDPIKVTPPGCTTSYSIPCLELPCPKAGRAYVTGLEHAELVIGGGICGNDALLAFVARCHAEGVLLALDESGLQKESNADVTALLPVPATMPQGSAALHMSAAGAGSQEMHVKFHQRPIDEVVAFELAEGVYKPVPENYFEGAA